MTRWHSLWLLASFAISFGANHVLKPRFDYAALGMGGTLPTGAVELSGSTHGEMKISDVRAVAVDTSSPLGRDLSIRVLWLRSAQADAQGLPDIELFVDFSNPDGTPVDPLARNVASLRGRALPVLAKAVASDLTSHVRLPGADAPAEVVRGSLTLHDALVLGDNAWRVRGSLELELRQGDELPAVNGNVAARLVWE